MFSFGKYFAIVFGLGKHDYLKKRRKKKIEQRNTSDYEKYENSKIKREQL